MYVAGAHVDLFVLLSLGNKITQCHVSAGLQSPQARLDLEEYRKQKAVRKAAAAASNGAAVAPASGASLSIDIEKLRHVEQLVLALQATAKSGKDPAPQQQQQRLGPTLPTRPSKQGGEKRQHSPAVELASLCEGDESCRVYFRECGGLQAAAQVVVVAAAQAEVQQQQQLGGQASKALQGPDSVLSSAGLTDFVSLLTTACINDGNAMQLPKQQGLLPAVLGMLSAVDHATVAAAARLLASVAVNDDVRLHISRIINDKGCLPNLVAQCSKAPPQLQVHILTLLSNCMLDHPGRAALRTACQGSSSSSSAAAELLAHWSQLITSPVPAVAERALTMVANSAEDPQVLGALAQEQHLVLSVLTAFITSGQASTAPGGPAITSSEATSSANLELSRCSVAAGSALLNLASEPHAQEAIAGSGKVAHLVALLKHPTWQVVARLATTLARCAKHAAISKLLVQLQGVPTLAQLLGRTLDFACGKAKKVDEDAPTSSSQESKTTAAAGVDKEVAAALDACVRALTTLVTDATEVQGAPQSVISAGGVALMHTALTLQQLPESVLGNAALCIANLVRHAALLPAVRAACIIPDSAAAGVEDEPASEVHGAPDLSQARACLIAALLRAAYLGQGKAASKNAGIALARLAQDPQLRARLRQLRGIEIIHAMTARAM